MIHIFIVNPYAGRKTFAEDLRNKLSHIKGIEYFIFNTTSSNNEEVLVKKILHTFEGKKLRFYCCGGSGTMRNVLNGFEDLSKVEIGFFPCGFTNDFLKVFGEKAKEFKNIEKLIKGKPVKVDYIKTNHGVALNSFSIGIDALMAMKIENFRFISIFGVFLPYFMSFMTSVFLTKPLEVEITMDGGECFDTNVTELVMLNGSTVAGNVVINPGADILNGEGVYLYTKNLRGYKFLSTLKTAVEKRKKVTGVTIEKGICKRISLRRKDGKFIEASLDGEVITGKKEWNIEIVQEGLSLILPEGVSVYG
ncbi:Diacylglycerol kinase family enzyme [Acetitomaculum ruminis DSM 5522]|uniref:Diacylglycerol kinase family enzyme n=1 Tax=Acetitomaculum ruminis DSM 5522 TaxID=1120918 RepID=A0A1I0W769_9FIRM|nr:diacylglycerol kinase family protein [Acetitomaculum ruminis]SFA83756.1 Diacylglycerol kinase family enzyme [Acetitomaculum ruminis DSM 5522]